MLIYPRSSWDARNLGTRLRQLTNLLFFKEAMLVGTANSHCRRRHGRPHYSRPGRSPRAGRTPRGPSPLCRHRRAALKFASCPRPDSVSASSKSVRSKMSRSPPACAPSLQLPRSIAECKRLIREFQPRRCLWLWAVTPPGPAMVAALLMKVPAMVFEPNAMPGFANRLVGKRVQAAAVNFPPLRVVQQLRGYRHPRAPKILHPRAAHRRRASSARLRRLARSAHLQHQAARHIARAARCSSGAHHSAPVRYAKLRGHKGGLPRQRCRSRNAGRSVHFLTICLPALPRRTWFSRAAAHPPWQNWLLPESRLCWSPLPPPPTSTSAQRRGHGGRRRSGHAPGARTRRARQIARRADSFAHRSRPTRRHVCRRPNTGPSRRRRTDRQPRLWPPRASHRVKKIRNRCRPKSQLWLFSRASRRIKRTKHSNSRHSESLLQIPDNKKGPPAEADGPLLEAFLIYRCPPPPRPPPTTVDHRRRRLPPPWNPPPPLKPPPP